MRSYSLNGSARASLIANHPKRSLQAMFDSTFAPSLYNIHQCQHRGIEKKELCRNIIY